MKTAVVLFLSLAAAAFAADPKPVKDPDVRGTRPEEVKRLGSVTWDLESHKLVWVVQKGAMVEGKFVPMSEQRYEIAPDKAVMAMGEDERGFDADEAVSLHHLLDVLSLYCAESVVWWDDGQGAPVERQPGSPTAKPKPDGKRDEKGDKPVKVGQPDPERKPKYKVPADHIVAMAK
jgi:hypothetical protein